METLMFHIELSCFKNVSIYKKRHFDTLKVLGNNCCNTFGEL